MDSREAMAKSGPASYYVQRGISGGASGSSSHPGLHGPAPMLGRSLQNPSASSVVHPSFAGPGSAAFHVESTPPPATSIAVPGAGAGEAHAGAWPGQPVRKKRGRPRKYRPEEPVGLALAPISAPPPPGMPSGSGLGSPPGPVATPKRGRGRPPGSGRKQQLSLLGEWMAGSAGTGFTPHAIRIGVGEDIASKIMSFSHQGPRAVCIFSANGAVSTVTLQQPASSGGNVTYEGRFEILCLSGSYMLTDDGGIRSRTGGLSISLSGPDGRVIGGSVGGLLIAATPVQVIVGSFMYSGNEATKAKGNQEPGADQSGPPATGDSSSLPAPMFANPNLAHMMGGWQGSGHADIKPGHLDIDLTWG